MRVREWTSGDQSSGGASEAARLKPRLGPAAEAADTPRVYGQRRAASLLAHYIPAPMPKPCSRLAWSAAACTYLLIIHDAIRRSTGSGMGCGDHWPLCNGKLFPPLDLPTLIEYGHRLAAALVSVLVSGLAAYAWWLRRRAGSGEQYVPSRTAYFALGLLSVQVVLGAVTVKLALRPWTVILHLGTAMLLLATLIVTAQGKRLTPGLRPGLVGPGLVALALGFATVLFGALTANVGAATACLGFPLCHG